MDYRDKLVENYFSVGFQQNEIISMLELVHRVKVHPRTLKRILCRLKLCRRKNYSDIGIVVNFINSQLANSGQLHGYRWMHLKCIQHGLIVTQKTVREVLALLDPEGVYIRKRKRLRRRRYFNEGPNAVWHIDSYDKLKRYGICINGAIDGFSRHIIWLHAGRTSSNPKVIAGYYLSAIMRLGGCPHTIRADMGTENGTIEAMQTALCQIFTNPEQCKPPFIYGKSTANQRIESWWSNLRKQCAQFWINLFETLDEENMFNGSFLDKSLMQFCFLKIIQEDLDAVVQIWNSHRIRGSKKNRLCLGRPTIMYQAPSLFGAENKLIPISEAILRCLEDQCLFYSNPCDHSIMELCRNIISENNITVSVDDPYSAVKLYVDLRTMIIHLMQQH
ncbi:uncharacterized protein LOC116164477 [Photinus pyralis]|uniref:uncharacterized protein LOC116164477 n=1 Tax=Photinus pyralis TaxID=7054 RepID=UPI0012675320|nr:uncharacterized protein LOC116164477 [Photinus pyralis]